MKKYFLYFLLIITFNQDLISQNISGIVKDKISLKPLSGVKVDITNLDTGVRDSVFTNASGQWQFNILTDVRNEIIPNKFYVSQNFPNPFNPSTRIQFSINKADNVEIFIHNILGELVDYKQQYLTSGIYSVDYSAKGAAGVYFYTIKTGNESVTKKMIQLDGNATGNGLQTIYSIGNLSVNTLNKSLANTYKIVYSKISHLADSVQLSLNGGESLMMLLTSFHSVSTLIDLHNDVLEVMVNDSSYHLKQRHNYNHTDIPRLKDGGVDLQFFSVWVSPTQYTNYYQQAQFMLNIFNSELSQNTTSISQARNWLQADSLIRQNKIAAVIGVEGGHHIENSIDKLINLYNAGMRYMTITWNNSTDWAVSAQDSRSTTVGLSDFGRQVIRTMDSLGIIIDVSHTGIKTIQDILQETQNPIVATHSGVRALRNHYRNLYDWQIQDIANSGGVIGVVFYPYFLNGSSNANIEDVIAHIDYIKNLVGIDYVAIGSDFDGIEVVPLGLEDTSKFPNLTEALFEHGYSRDDVEKILYKNFKRVFEQVCGNK
ncbi:Zn-dependent membrane dipeptidase [Ignavibacterium album JCM 16511]|uniref:Zn-dependent membrane dipeptidase n=1 Tax=Ignavibacterium album (strain DSM 19864 / JCM 16511 / NBRC 101810 / Mat9-16) TaxID=945713 RepID=I0AIA8_IGNAJ|nr:membrane dipeptidase [Ignavibacterium album]AFH48715.1 Zn-dependent membrane dipeptidase [Ignavibacterium album JCM 16511]